MKMLVRIIILATLLGFFQTAYGKYGFWGEQEWGFSEVRQGAHMFYWLHYTTANVSSFEEKPVLLWLQGGPGISSSGNGYFEEIGPYNFNFAKRNITLFDDYNILFIDYPVGTGFSYIDADGSYANSDQQMVSDLLQCIYTFHTRHPIFLNMPTYIFGESYGGKIAVFLANEWSKAIKTGFQKGNLKGIALANAWISPVDSLLTYAPYLYYTGMVDGEGQQLIMSAVNKIKDAIDTKKWELAYDEFCILLKTIFDESKNLDFQNIINKVQYEYRDISADIDRIIRRIMNFNVKHILRLPKDFNIDRHPALIAMAEDYMKPVIDKVEYLLNKTDIDVFVFNGQLDLLVSIPGTLKWIQKLHSKNPESAIKDKRKSFVINDIVEGHVKSYGKLKMYWVKRAGHMVSVDNPSALRKILHDLTRDAYKQKISF